jgi:hypothetical protein
MIRVWLPGILLAGLALGSVGPAAALDYDEPVVPSQFLISPPAPAGQPDAGSLRTLTLREQPRAGQAPTTEASPPSRPQGVGRNQWSADGGCALWSWNSC